MAIRPPEFRTSVLDLYPVFRTTDIDLSAAVWTEIDEKPKTHPGKSLIEFVFKDSESVRNVVCAYASGLLMQDVKKFAARRGLLYRLAREAAAAGGAR